MSYSSASRPALDMLNDHYSPYSPPDSASGDDDENASLRSQALNADGTPKRPMNAFMIFARRRRPQVSAANQMMRTGEISKILSKEWNTMPMSDKQFYLDQAKKLKENFNAKYPDYVYRRRPNNSRKKRRTDASIRGVDAYGDPRDDSDEHSPDYHHSVSPVDGLVPNEQSVALAAQQYRMPYSAHPHYHPEASAASAYPYYSQSHHARHAHAHHYDSLHSSVSFPPAHAHAHAHSPSIYHPDDDALWPAPASGSGFPRLEPVKLEPAWASGLSARRGTLQPPPLRPATQHHHHHGRHWSESSGGTGSPASAPATATSFPPFQTLTAPFYPSSGTVSPSTASSSSAASYFGGAGATGTGSADREFDAHNSSTATPAAGHSPPFHAQSLSLHAPRTYSGPTLGSTLALSPGAGAGLWSNTRTSSTTATTKSEL